MPTVNPFEFSQQMDTAWIVDCTLRAKWLPVSKAKGARLVF